MTALDGAGMVRRCSRAWWMANNSAVRTAVSGGSVQVVQVEVPGLYRAAAVAGWEGECEPSV